MKLDRTAALFWAMCLIWGLTWIAVKAGVAAVPPLIFAASRFTAAGLLLFGFLWVRGWPCRIARADWARMIAASLLMVALCYGLLFWGMLFVNSGTAAMLELSFTPVALLAFALALRHETFNVTRALAILLGVFGVAVLFGARSAGAPGSGAMEPWGAAAVVVAAVVYGAGSVLSKPLLRAYSPALVAATTMLIGGLVLLACALILEPGSWDALKGRWGLAPWLGWLFLVVFGSLAGYTAYMHVLREWGASRAGSFAFVSPVIAVVAGYMVFGERISSVEAAGMAVMLLAAWLALREKPLAVTEPLGRTREKVS